MVDGPALAVDESPTPAQAARSDVRSWAPSLRFRIRRALRRALSAAANYNSWVWRLALLVGVLAYGLAMAIALSAHPHI